jgi:hypothetical protein
MTHHSTVALLRNPNMSQYAVNKVVLNKETTTNHYLEQRSFIHTCVRKKITCLIVCMTLSYIYIYSEVLHCRYREPSSNRLL